MAFTVFRTSKGVSPEHTPADSGSEKDLRSRQIDELCRLSDNARREFYGPNHDEDTRQFYNLLDKTRRTPTFRPKISAPQLQVLLLSEAGDLTDSRVRVTINHKETGRDKERERAFQEHWRQEQFDFALLQSKIYSQFAGTAFIQVGFDPLARRGDGSVWMAAREQRSVYCDTISPWPNHWSWQVVEDLMYLDEIKLRYPDRADQIKPRTAKAEQLAGPPAGGIEMPPGPMSVTVRGLPGGEQYSTDGVLSVRTLFAKDASIVEPTDAQVAAFEKRGMVVPKYLPKYPLGRMIVDCEGTILVDGHSWVPLGLMWPAIPVWSMPPWDNVWCPPPSKYSRSLQEAGERMMSQTEENARRLNNGMIVINAASDLTADSVGGMPGEILVISANSPQNAVEIKYPAPMPAQMIQLPQTYFAFQKELQGFTAARQGNPGAGNVGSDLFDSAVSQSQSITRLRSKLFSYSVQKAAELVFYTMCKFYKNPRHFYSNSARQVPEQKSA
jgi:hypothetical protein